MAGGHTASLAQKVCIMSKRKRQIKKKLVGKGRTNDAKRWLQSRAQPKNIIEAYSKRYAVSEMVARHDLISIGYYDEVTIQEYEKEGIKYEYMVEPLSGEMHLVLEGTEEYQLYEQF